MTPTQPFKRALVVAGMHRSGTSALAKAISLMGATLPRDPILAGLGNAAGHWEPRPIVDLNDTIFAQFDASWSEPEPFLTAAQDRSRLDQYRDQARQLIRTQFGDERMIVLKDPRVSLLADFWEEALAAEGFDTSWIIMVRRPEDVAASLAVRDGVSIKQTYLLWAIYMATVDQATGERNRIYCYYNDLIDDSQRSIERIFEKFRLPLPNSSTLSKAIKSLDAKYRHHKADIDKSFMIGNVDDTFHNSLENIVSLLWQYFIALSRGENIISDTSTTALKLIQDLPKRNPFHVFFHDLGTILRKISKTFYRLILGSELERLRVRDAIFRKIGLKFKKN